MSNMRMPMPRGVNLSASQRKAVIACVKKSFRNGKKVGFSQARKRRR